MGVGEKVKKKIIFNCFVPCQVFNEFNARKLDDKNAFAGIHKKKLFIGIVGVTVVVQVVMVCLVPREVVGLSTASPSFCILRRSYSQILRK